MTPRATYRVQFSRAFTFADAVDIVPYLARLGISHLYSSPILTARAGSTHGYDIVDHASINPELGGRAGFDRLVATLHAHEMGILLDIVPNHMGVGGSDNRLWLDVLEWGRASPYATWFDIDWEPAEARLRGHVLLPFLGQQYGVELESGNIALRLDRRDGSLSAWYHHHRFPIAPRHYPQVLHPASGQSPMLDGALQGVASAVAPSNRSLPAIRKAFAEARQALAASLDDSIAHVAIDGALQRFDAATAEGRDQLHDLLERQSYRVAWWRAAADEINYRRFFNINDLAGFRVEVPGAFDAAHALLLELWSNGSVDGFRIDHVDGLADPRAYCRKLRRRMLALAGHRPSARSREPWIIVEKILARHEHVPTAWQVDGTTGYEFMDAVGGLLHEPAGEAALSELHAEITGDASNFHDHALVARRQILRDYLASELAGVALVAHRVLQRNPQTRDFTLTGIRRALAEIAAHFPVYRTYCSEAGPGIEDARTLEWAFTGARRGLRATEHALLDALLPLLSGRMVRHSTPGATRRDLLLVLRRFEQLTGPTAAKAIEDTAFYRYVRLLSRNEVGSDPAQFATPPATFSRQQRRRRQTPLALLATATHDHKRGEDTRARLAVLSERTEEWKAAVHRWMRLNAPLKVAVDSRPAPSPADEYQLYQTLVGAWPPHLEVADTAALAAFVERVEQWLLKAVREAKFRTDWDVGNTAYEDATLNFLRASMAPNRTIPLAEEIAAFSRQIAPQGMLKGLTQLALKCLSLGVPDIYQGTEVWDFSLVDPDNRRPVDYTALAALADQDPGNGWTNGAIKQQFLMRFLALRRSRNALFLRGRQLPIRLVGDAPEDFFAQLIVFDGSGVLLIAPRLTARLDGARRNLAFILPREFDGATGSDVFRRTVLQMRRQTTLPTFPAGDPPLFLYLLERPQPLDTECTSTSVRAAVEPICRDPA
jgi:(1->4)-alpha-D-glucan 1-alpha-D-glucosylmutase